MDVYIRRAPDPVGAAIARALLYAEAGADCVYPIAAPSADLPALRAALGALPINTLPGPGGPSGPSFAALGRLGATRITFGDGLLQRTRDDLSAFATKLRLRGGGVL